MCPRTKRRKLNGPAMEGVGAVKKDKVRARIEEIGIIPGIRVSSAEEARFAAETVNRGGIPIAEITVTVPGAMEVISELTRKIPEMIVGAGTVLDVEMARRGRRRPRFKSGCPDQTFQRLSRAIH